MIKLFEISFEASIRKGLECHSTVYTFQKGAKCITAAKIKIVQEFKKVNKHFELNFKK